MVLPLGDLEKTRIIPLATYTLIALNVVMYLLQLDRGDGFTTALAATPFEISHGIDIKHPFSLPEPDVESPLQSTRYHTRRAGPDPVHARDVAVPPRQPTPPGREHAFSLDLRR